MLLRRRIAFVGLLASTLALLSACGGDSNSGDGQVRLVNATSEYASFDFYQSTTLLASNVASFAGSSYVSLGDGSYTFNVKASGSGTTSISSVRSLSKDQSATLIAYTTGGSLVSALLTEAETAPSAGAAKFRLFNTATAEAGAVDVYLLSGADCSTLSTTSAATATNVSTFSSYAEVTAVAAGTAYHVCVTAAGDKTDLRLDVPSVRLTDQQIVTLVLARSTGGTLLHGLLMTQKGSVVAARNTAARVRVAAAAASRAAVSASVSGTVLGTSVVSPSIGAYRLVPAGSLTTSVSIAGTAVPAAGLTGAAGADLTLLVAGTVAAPTIALLSDDNTPSTNTAKPVKLRLVNALNGVTGPVSLTVDGSLIADSVSFATASNPVNVATSAALATLDVTFSGELLYHGTLITLSTGRVYTLFLAGDLGVQPYTGILRVDR